MGGLLKDFALTALIIILNHWIYGVEDTISYDYMVQFMTRNSTLILSVSFVVSLTLLFASAMFETLGLYRITYGIGKILIRICQFLLTFLAIVNIIFYAALGNNLLRSDHYMVIFSLALLLCASVWSIRVIDFNYSSQNALAPTGTLVLMSLLIVEVIWPYTGL
jgi:hypothetical protein